MKTSLSSTIAMLLITGPIFALQPANSQTIASPTGTAQTRVLPTQQNTSANLQINQSNRQSNTGLGKSSKNQLQGGKADKTAQDVEAKNPGAETQSSGGADPGGGAFIRVNGKLVSMAAAGAIFKRTEEILLLPKEYPTFFIIPGETKEAVHKLVAKLPISEWYRDNVANAILAGADRSIFIEQRKISAQDYEKVKADYRKVISSFGLNLSPSALVFAAYSKDGKTFMLDPYLTKELDADQQAQNLLHEYIMREFTDLDSLNRLAIALQVDSAIYELLNSPQSKANDLRFALTMLRISSQEIKVAAQRRQRDEDYYPFQRSDRAARLRVSSLFNSNIISEAKKNAAFNLFQQLQDKLGRAVLASEVILQPSDVVNASAVFEPSLVKQFNALVPMLAETLETKWISEMDQLFYRANQDNFSYKEYLSWLTYYSKNNSSFVRPNLPQAPIEYFAQLFDQQCVLNQQALAQSEFKSAERIIYYDSSTQLLFMIACRQYMESLGKPIRGFGASMTVSIDIH